MKRYIFALVLSLLLCAGKSYATIVELNTVISSVTRNNTNGVKLATGSIIVESVTVISTGSGGSQFGLFDATVLSTTSQYPSLHPSTSAARASYDGFTGATVFQHDFNTVFSSGVHYNNLPPTGGIAPTLHIRYRYKSLFISR